MLSPLLRPIKNPDVAESFFKYSSAVCFWLSILKHGLSNTLIAQVIAKFPSAFVSVPSVVQSTCMQMAVMALSSSEQFTLRTAIEFLVRDLPVKLYSRVLTLSI